MKTNSPLAPASDIRILRIRDVVERTTLCATTIRRLVRENRFPPPIALGGRAKGWPEYLVDAWLESCLACRSRMRTLQDPIDLPRWTPALELRHSRCGIRMLRLRAVARRVSVKKSHVYRLIAWRRFPAPAPLGERRRAWCARGRCGVGCVDRGDAAGSGFPVPHDACVVQGQGRWRRARRQVEAVRRPLAPGCSQEGKATRIRSGIVLRVRVGEGGAVQCRPRSWRPRLSPRSSGRLATPFRGAVESRLVRSLARGRPRSTAASPNHCGGLCGGQGPESSLGPGSQFFKKPRSKAGSGPKGGGGGGGNRTRVRWRSAVGSTCLASSTSLTVRPPTGRVATGEPAEL